MNKRLTTIAFLPTMFFMFNNAGLPVLDDKLDMIWKLSNISFALEQIM